MKALLKKRLLVLGASQLFIIVLSYVINRNISLISYINISFYISSALLLSSLLIYTIHSGFFDVISKSFNLAFTRERDKRKFHEVPAISELVSNNQKPLLFYGLWIGFFMIIALIVFYI